jgi:hypothetical protein
MKLYNAILLTLCLYLGGIVISWQIHHNLVIYIVIVTTLWAAVDSSKLKLKRYRSGVGPAAFFCLCLMLWIVGFPWYLQMRHKILTGKAELKTNDPRCVRCEELIDPALADCPKCGWRQPK